MGDLTKRYEKEFPVIQRALYNLMCDRKGMTLNELINGFQQIAGQRKKAARQNVYVESGLTKALTSEQRLVAEFTDRERRIREKENNYAEGVQKMADLSLAELYDGHRQYRLQESRWDFEPPRRE